MAGIKINAPFELGAAVPVDTRLTLSKAEMLTVNDNVWPSKYLTVCSDDGAIYLYDKTNEMDVETGKFRILSTDLSNCLEKVSTMPVAQEGKAYCYTGADTADYKNGQIYAAGLTTVAGASGNGFHTFDKGDNGLVLATAEGVDTIAVGTKVLVQYDTENHYYVFDTIVEDATDNKLYPSSKVGEAEYECQTSSVNTSYADSYNVLAWVPGIKDAYDKIEERLEKVSVMPNASLEDYENHKVVVFNGTDTTEYKTGKTYKADKIQSLSGTFYETYNGYYSIYTTSSTLVDGMSAYCTVDTDFGTGLVKVVLHETATTGQFVPNDFDPAHYTFNSNDTSSSPTSSLANVIDWVNANDISDDLLVKLDKRNTTWISEHQYPTEEDLNYMFLAEQEYSYGGLGIQKGYVYQVGAKEVAGTYYDWYNGYNHVYTTANALADGIDVIYATGWKTTLVEDSDNPGEFYVSGHEGNFLYKYTSDNYWGTSDSVEMHVWSSVTYDELASRVEKIAVFGTALNRDLGRVGLYTGETTTSAPIYVHGHFYECKLVSNVPEWVELDTEVDDYDHIENRPLELTRGVELYNDTVTLDAGDTTSVTLTDKVLVADKKYVISVDGTEHEYTATLDSSDDSINIDASDIGIVISTADAATDSTMTLTNSQFSADPAIIVKEANIVNVNPDYEEFFDNLGKESALSTDVTANTTVGGFEEDDVAPEGMTFTQFATKLLHVYKEPTLAFTSTATTYLLNKDGGVVEQPFTLTATATKQDLDIVETWIEDAEGTKLATGTTTASYIVETNVYDDVSYKAFTKDAKKTIAPKTIAYEFIYGFFKGTSATVPEASADVKALTLDLTKKAKKEYAFTASNQYLTVAYPASYGNLTKITDQNGFANLDAWNKTVVAVSMNVWDDTEGDYVATDVNYNVYTTNDKITCSNFKYTFEF